MRPPKPQLALANIKRLSDEIMNTITSDTNHNIFEAISALNEITASLIHCRSEYPPGFRLHFAIESFKIALEGHEAAAIIIAAEEAKNDKTTP